MPFVFTNQPVLDAIKSFKTSNNLVFKSVDCKFDYLDNRFQFVEGKDCESETDINRIGSRITKRAIREMVNRFKNENSKNEDEVFCIDYGIEIIKSLLTEETRGIRFYFGKRNIGDGNDFISLILVGLDGSAKEIIKTNLDEADVAGVEVGHGHKFKELNATKDSSVFKLANFK